MVKGSFLEWIESNLVSLLLAILLALVVWVLASQEANPAEDFTFEQPIPIQYIGPQDGLIITNDPPDTVTVQVRAPRSAVRSLTVSNFVAVVDLTGLEPGTHTLPIDVSIVDAQAIRRGYFPTQARVVLEEVATREVPVQLVLNGDLPLGYQTGPLAVEPSAVRVSGPATGVQLVSEVQASIDIGGRRDPVNTTLPLVALDSEGNVIENVDLEPAEVDVEVPIFQEADFREVAVRVNANVQPAPGYYVTSITASPPLVPVRGDPQILENLTSIETEPISLSGVEEDRTYVAQLRPPEGVTLEDTRTVNVLITIEAQLDFRNVEVPIEAVGLGEGLVATIRPGTAVVSLRGPLPVLQRLNEQQDIVVSVDTTRLEPGTYRLEPRAEIVSSVVPQEDLNDVIVDSVLPTVVDVEITEEDGAEAP